MASDMSKIFETFLKMDGQKFTVERDGKALAKYEGLTNSDKHGVHYIGFRPHVDIQPGDWLLNTVNDRFYVKDRIMNYVNGEPNELKIFYFTEAEYNSNQTQSTSTIFNISNASGSVIGNNNSVSVSYSDALTSLKNSVQNSDSSDKAELQKIVNLLEMIVNNELPASKGVFSKFSAVMERNSWITGSIAGVILNWLTSLM